MHKTILIFVGISSIAIAFLGLLSYFPIIYVGISSVTEDHDLIYFVDSVYVMVGTSIIFLISLFVTGIQLIKLNSYWVNILVIIVLAEIVYMFAVGTLWHHQEYGASIAAATGVGSSGLSIQLQTLFIIWAPSLALYVKYKGSNKTPQSTPKNGATGL